jgi:hypothetical protein
VHPRDFDAVGLPDRRLGWVIEIDEQNRLLICGGSFIKYSSCKRFIE